MDFIPKERRFNMRLSLDDIDFLRFEPDADKDLGYGYDFLSVLGNREPLRVARNAGKDSFAVILPKQYIEVYLGSSAIRQLLVSGKFEMVEQGYHFRVEMPDYISATSEWQIPKSA